MLLSPRLAKHTRPLFVSGPVFGPLGFVEFVPIAIRKFTRGGKELTEVKYSSNTQYLILGSFPAGKIMGRLEMRDGLIYYNGMYYEGFSAVNSPKDETFLSEQKFEKKKAKWPEGA